jgi:integrase
VTGGAQAAAAVLSSDFFSDDEPVFQGFRTLIPGVPVPLFGERGFWRGDCLRRPVNRTRGEWKLALPEDPVWNLRAREVCFSMLNSTHRVLRKAGIFLPTEEWGFATVKQYSSNFRGMARWSVKEGMPQDLAEWTTEDWQGYLDDQKETIQAQTLVQHVAAIRKLHQFSAVITGGGLREDPWPGKTDAQVAEVIYSADLATPSVSPKTWWPLLRAAWAYVDRFAPEILDERDARVEAAGQDGPSGTAYMDSDEIDALLTRWLEDPANLVPVHAEPWRGQEAGTPIFSSLSLMVTGGHNHSIFIRNKGARALARREAVMKVVAQGRTRAVRGFTGPLEGKSRTGGRRPAPRRREDLDAAVRTWLADPANLVPVHDGSTDMFKDLEPNWTWTARLIFGPGEKANVFTGKTEPSRQRQQMIREAVAAGQFRREGFGVLARELRMVRAACYIFIAALTLMRDSEVQEIVRGGVTQYYGAPALISRKIKRNTSQSQDYWWVIEPVAKAIAVAERLSWHETHIFATMSAPTDKQFKGRAGILAAADIDFFVRHVNARREETGLEEIPRQTIRPHMLRKTMSVIASMQPDGEIALGIQLKHAARRALANRVTAGYGRPDPEWAKEFDNQLELAAARKLVGLLKARGAGEDVAIGPGAARFHAGLDRVLASLGDDPVLQAQVADERLQVSLLRDEFADLHLGTINHCLWQPSTAECQNQLPAERRGEAPLIGACQPAKCRNSVLTRSHAPIWLAEEGELVETLARQKLSPPRRELVTARLAEVQAVTAHFKEGEGDL